MQNVEIRNVKFNVNLDLIMQIVNNGFYSKIAKFLKNYLKYSIEKLNDWIEDCYPVI